SSVVPVAGVASAAGAQRMVASATSTFCILLVSGGLSAPLDDQLLPFFDARKLSRGRGNTSQLRPNSGQAEQTLDRPTHFGEPRTAVTATPAAPTPRL